MRVSLIWCVVFLLTAWAGGCGGGTDKTTSTKTSGVGNQSTRKPTNAPTATEKTGGSSTKTVIPEADPEAAPEANNESTPQTPQREEDISVTLSGGVTLELVHVPAGTFMIVDTGVIERPKHEVTITKPFYLGKYEVTQEQWEAVMGANPSDNTAPKNPVENVSWDDCQAFLAKLNEQSGDPRRRFCLPTEAQWEYACRAGSATKYSFGDDDAELGEHAWCADNSGGVPHPVGEKLPNAWGLHDMLGNVWEWCADWYEYDYCEVVLLEDPTGPPSGNARLYRGGGCYLRPADVRPVNRFGEPPDKRRADLGLRVALVEVSEPAEVTPTTAETTFTNTLGMKFALIPAGEFLMGSPRTTQPTYFGPHPLKRAMSALAVDPAELPRHRVTITRPFYLGVYEVTLGDFRRFADDTAYKTDSEKDEDGDDGWNKAVGRMEGPDPKYSWRHHGFPQDDSHPVSGVSWNDAVAFCEWLSKKEGRTYRLPTEAEWEYACRAGTTTAYCYGDDQEGVVEYGNVEDATAWEKLGGGLTIESSDGFAFTSPVGSFRPNAFGLYDMHGNVSEWCADIFDDEYYAESPKVDPTGPTSGQRRVRRGGSFYLDVPHWRSAARTGDWPDFYSVCPGFRVALELLE